MSELKARCKECGADILAATALRTGGVCMPCKNGGSAPEWARRRLWLRQGADPLAGLPWHRSPWAREIAMICRKLVAGEMGCIEGARRMAQLSTIVLDAAHGDKWLHEDWSVFFEVLASEDDAQSVEESFMEPVRGAALKLLKEAGVSGAHSL